MKRKISTFIAAVLALSMLAGCKPTTVEEKDMPINNTEAAQNKEKEVPSETANSGDTEINLFVGDIVTLNSAKASDAASFSIVSQTQTALLRIKDGVLIGEGAESWEPSEDGYTWTFHLRDAKWSDGKKITADDYVYGIMMTLDPQTASDNAGILYVIEGAEEYNTAGTNNVGVTAIDENTLEIKLKDPIPYFDQLTNHVSFTPVREDIVAAQGDTYGSDPMNMIFSGPYVVSDWTRGATITLEKNPAYWNADGIQIDKANFIINAEQETKQQLFENKQLDAVTNVVAEYADRITPMVDSGDVILAQFKYPSSGYIVFNNQDPNNIFTNAKVRAAFSLSLDRETLVKNVMKKDEAAYGFIPYSVSVGTVEYRTSVEEPLKSRLSEDPKVLLEEGLTELGLDPKEPITVTFLQGSNTQERNLLGEFYQNQWQTKLGVTVKIDVAADAATFNRMTRLGDYQISQTGWGADYNDPMTFMQLFMTGDGNNSALLSNEKYDALIRSTMSENDMSKRLEAFTEAEKLLVADEAVLAPLTYSVKNFYTQSYVENLIVFAGGPEFGELRDAFIKK